MKGRPLPGNKLIITAVHSNIIPLKEQKVNNISFPNLAEIQFNTSVI